jgi:hypothetical protein
VKGPFLALAHHWAVCIVSPLVYTGLLSLCILLYISIQRPFVWALAAVVRMHVSGAGAGYTAGNLHTYIFSIKSNRKMTKI